MLGYDDKRNFYRMMVNSPCEVRLLDQPSVTSLSAVCRDISATGMSLELDLPSIELGASVAVTIESNSDQIPTLEAKAKVVRCEAGEDETCLIGVEITDMK
ncbi:PilZ domain-containing protein [Agaribacter flavus]|uniref:PilZ domain-containing protein n=1 Tax=Agaribacter flavus TaxID=1902781 RepID=A0ABV7FT65_9ALTE